MAKEQESTTTTLNVSRPFAALLSEAARDTGESIREYCDRELAPILKPKVKRALAKRLQSIDLGGEA